MVRKKLKKEERMQVYNKYDGRCAYCGKKIEYNEMQVDHLLPLCLAEEGHGGMSGLDSMENYMPACRLCNHYKRSSHLETFRKMIAAIPDKLERDSYIFRVGCRYENVQPAQKPIVFYFERQEREQ